MARILVIDDDELVRFTLRRILDARRHEVVEAEDGNQGLALQAAHAFDLVITDLLMPEKEGIETILELKQADPALRIIAISGGGVDGYAGYLKSASRLGANHTLAKPFSHDDLLRCVDACLDEVA